VVVAAVELTGYPFPAHPLSVASQLHGEGREGMKGSV